MDFFLGFMGFLACIALLVGAIVGAIYIVCEVLDSAGTISSLWHSTHEHHQRLSDLGQRVAKFENAAKQPAAKSRKAAR